MDGFTLRCNNLRCRGLVDIRAIVTTCCHVFCIPCGETLHLTNPPANHARRCPACETVLSAPDDCVVSILNPTDDYKTSVLSGLSPSIILEICGRGLAFWNYQVTQEVVYQEHLAKSLTEKYANLSAQLDKIIHEANSEIARLRDKLAVMTATEEDLRRKNHELMEGWREKGRKLAQTQELYDKLKRRTLISQVRDAASETVDQTLLMSAQRPPAAPYGMTPLGDPLVGRNSSAVPVQSSRRHRDREVREPDFVMTGARIGNINGGGPGPKSADGSSNGMHTPPPRMYRSSRRDIFAQDPLVATPSGSQEHRQRLPPTPSLNQNLRNGVYISNAAGVLGTARNPLNLVSGNAQRMGGGGHHSSAFGKTRGR